MSPQPLGQVKPDARLHIGPLAPAGEFDPDLCRQATYVISLWSYTETRLLRMASSFLKSEQSLVTDMLQAVKSSDGRRAAIRAAGEHRLANQPGDLTLFLAALDALAHAELLRNRYTHHVWASSPDIPGAIILVDPRLVGRAVAAEAEGATGRGWLYPGASHFDRMQVMVYRSQDLKEDVTEAVDAALIADGIEDWYAWLACDARELATHSRDLLLEQFPRLRRAFEKRQQSALGTVAL
jgi:hypothetical protein